MKPLPYIISIAVFVLPCSASLAQRTEPRVMIEETVVTASRIEESIASIAGTVMVIDKQAIDQQIQAGQHIGDVMGKLVPGFGVSSETNTHFNQTIRGRKALILIDGVPQYDNRDISRQLQNISIGVIERVEVISGASAVYGAGGTGGVINIITQRPSKDRLQYSTTIGLSTSLNKSGSDAINYSANQIVKGGGDKLDFLLSASLENIANFYDADGKRIAPEPAQTSLNDTDSYNILLKLGYDIDVDKRLAISMDLAKSEQKSKFGPNYGGPGVPALFGAAIPVSAVSGLTLEEQPNTEREAVTVDYQDRDFLGMHLRLQGFYRDRSYRFFPFGFSQNFLIQDNIAPFVGVQALPVTTVSQSTSDAEVSGAKLTFATKLNEQSELVWGADYSLNKGEESAAVYDVNTFFTSGGLSYQPSGEQLSYGPAVDTETTAVFLQGKLAPTSALTLRAGIRYEKISQDIHDTVPPLEALFFGQYGPSLLPLLPLLPAGTVLAPATLSGSKLNYNEVLFNAGFTYSTSSNSELFANYSEGFELPDAARILRDVVSTESSLPLLLQGLATPTIVSEASLEAVKVRSLELGWRARFNKASLSFVGFYNESDKTIDFLPDFTVALLDQTRQVSGAELVAEYKLSAAWDIGGTYFYARGTTENNALMRKTKLSSVEVSPPKATAYVQHTRERITVRLQALRLGSYDYDRVSNDTARSISSRSYTTADLTASVALAAGSLSLGVQNITNKQYQTVYSQWAGTVYGQTAGVPARGRMLSLSYSIDY